MLIIRADTGFGGGFGAALTDLTRPSFRAVCERSFTFTFIVRSPISPAVPQKYHSIRRYQRNRLQPKLSSAVRLIMAKWCYYNYYYYGPSRDCTADYTVAGA